jgi:cell division protein FtsI/penicillin-binding protein 2
MLKSSHHRGFDEKLQQRLKNTRFFSHIKLTKEIYLLSFFSLLFFILIIRLFFLQVINHSYYDTLLNQQQVSETSLKAKR